MKQRITHKNLTFGVNIGSGKIGIAVIRDNGDIVYMSEVVVKNAIIDKMA